VGFRYRIVKAGILAGWRYSCRLEVFLPIFFQRFAFIFLTYFCLFFFFSKY